MSFYTYVHMRADDGMVFYVGKGKGARAFTTRGRNPMWRRIVAKHGLMVEIAARWHTEDEAFGHEKFLIACFRDMGILLANLTDGGDGPTGFRHSKKARERMSLTRRGRRVSEESRAKMSASHKQREPHPNSIAALTGRPVSEATRRKMSESQRGREISPEHRRKIAAALAGRKQPEQVREKVASMVRTPEWRARHSAAMKGRPWSEARRAAFLRSKGER